MTIEKIAAAFDISKKKTGDKVIFTPEIKVKRDTDMLYISELRKTKVSLMAVVEVYKNKTSDKAPMPLGMLNDTALNAIYMRLSF